MKDFKRKVEVASGVLSAASLGVSLVREAREKANGYFLYTATVKSSAYVYPLLLDWLRRETSTKHIRFESTKREGVKSFYDGSGTAKVSVGGFTLKVSLQRPERPGGGDGSSFTPYGMPTGDELHFSARSQSAINALQDFLMKLTREQDMSEREVLVKNYGTYGWEQKKLPFRDIDSVILPAGEKEDLLGDIDTFLNSEGRYHTIGIPWHRGYMFYGEPGNGKSSLSSALAHHYRRSLYNMPLSTIKDDTALASAVADIEENSFLLVEDIDIFSRAVSREQSYEGPTLSGLLNAFDGVSTPSGLVVIITTNRKDTLDPALIRPGRFDYQLEFKAPNDHQVEQMFERVYGEPLGCQPRQFESMAAVANVFKRSLTDPEAARLKIKS